MSRVNPKGFFRSGRVILRKHALPFMLDLAVILGAAFFWTSIFQWFRFYHYLIFTALLRWKKFDDFLPVKILFILLGIMFAGVSTTNFVALYCLSKGWLVICAAIIPAGIYLLLKDRRGGVRAFAYPFVPMMVLSSALLGQANRPATSEECESVRADKGVELLIDLPALQDQHGLPRFMVRRPDKNDLIVVYRTPVGGLGKYPYSADRFDLATRTLHPIRDITNEPIGLYYDRPRGKVYIITANKYNHARPVTLNVLGPDLSLEKIIDIPGGEDDEYTSHMMPYGDNVAIRTEMGDLYEFDPDSGSLRVIAPVRLEDKKRCRMFAEPGFLTLPGNRFVIAGGADLLIYNIAWGHSVCEYDIVNKKFTHTYRDPVAGSIDIAYNPDRNEVLVATAYRNWILVLSADDLSFKRRLPMPSCVRPLAYDAAKQLGYAAECYTGYLDAFDTETGEIKYRRSVGTNARKIYVYDDLGPVALTGCGLVRLREQEPDKN